MLPICPPYFVKKKEGERLLHPYFVKKKEGERLLKSKRVLFFSIRVHAGPLRCNYIQWHEKKGAQRQKSRSQL